MTEDKTLRVDQPLETKCTYNLKINTIWDVTIKH
jgi:hypothetical protein